jgi:hypothetical protein
MPQRHFLAVNSLGSTDVLELCHMLAAAAQDSLNAGVYPHRDAACRVIAHHVAGVCNADMPFLPHYQECYAFCCRQAEKDRLASPDAAPEPEPELKPN